MRAIKSWFHHWWRPPISFYALQTIRCNRRGDVSALIHPKSDRNLIEIWSKSDRNLNAATLDETQTQRQTRNTLIDFVLKVWLIGSLYVDLVRPWYIYIYLFFKYKCLICRTGKEMHSAASILWIESEWSDGSVCIDFPGPNRCNYFHFPPLICLFPGSRLFERGFDFLFFHLLICLFVNFFIATASGTFEPFLCPFLPPTLLNFLHVFCVGIFPLINGFVGSLRTLSRWCACCFTHRFFLWDVPDALRFFYYSFFFLSLIDVLEDAGRSSWNLSQSQHPTKDLWWISFDSWICPW